MAPAISASAVLDALLMGDEARIELIRRLLEGVRQVAGLAVAARRAIGDVGDRVLDAAFDARECERGDRLLDALGEAADPPQHLGAHGLGDTGGALRVGGGAGLVGLIPVARWPARAALRRQRPGRGRRTPTRRTALP